MAKQIPTTVSPYYAKQKGGHKKTLLEMRKRILEIIPKSEEKIKYGMPTFFVDGNAIAGILVNKNHIGYYPYSGSVIGKIPGLSERYKTTKGALHIPIGKPLPKATIKKLIQLRISICPVARGEVHLSKYEKLDGEWRKLGLAAPARRALVNGKIIKLEDLSKWKEQDLAKLHGMGPSALRVIRAEMKKQRLKFADER